MDSAEGQFSDDVAGVVEENSNGQKPETSCFKYFQFEDLKTATSNFEPEALLGEGGFGKVYKGWIDQETLAPSESGTRLAVAIKLWNPETIQAFEQWQSEINILGRRYHPNLIELLGYCWEDEMLVLVYEFMEKGSLQNHLFPNDSIEPLSWDIRLKIAIGGARGLAFLHTLDKQIIYRDFKPSAILLDANYNPKLSDFGLAKPGPSGDKTHVTTRMMGTYGYIAPEYVESGHLSVKSDVYSFGVVLLELLTGSEAVDLSWIKPMLNQKWKLNTIMDAQMEGQYPFQAAWQATQLTLKCLEVNHKDRPSMKEVLEALLQIEAITSTDEVPEVYEHVEALTSTEEVPKMLELIEELTTMKEFPEALKHVEVMKEEPKNSKFGSRPSIDHRHGQPRIHHRFFTSLKASFQCVSSKCNCIRIRGATRKTSFWGPMKYNI